MRDILRRAAPVALGLTASESVAETAVRVTSLYTVIPECFAELVAEPDEAEVIVAEGVVKGPLHCQ